MQHPFPGLGLNRIYGLFGMDRVQELRTLGTQPGVEVAQLLAISSAGAAFELVPWPLFNELSKTSVNLRTRVMAQLAPVPQNAELVFMAALLCGCAECQVQAHDTLLRLAVKVVCPPQLKVAFGCF